MEAVSLWGGQMKIVALLRIWVGCLWIACGLSGAVNCCWQWDWVSGAWFDGSRGFNAVIGG